MISSKILLTLGNPNSGKTTLFNQLTGAKQKVGNWTGVTVEKKTGVAKIENLFCHLIDLPGIYSIEETENTSQDERISLDALSNLACDAMLNVVDASTLERSLYLTLQLRELGKAVIVVLNKMDVVKQRGYEIDIKALSSLLGCPVLELNAKCEQSVFAFKANLLETLNHFSAQKPFYIDYGEPIEALLSSLKKSTQDPNFSRFDSLRLLVENNSASLENHSQQQAINANIATLATQIDIDLSIADARYSAIAAICGHCQKKVSSLASKITDSIDNLVLNRYLGIPCFLLVMYLMFMFSINIGSAFIDFFDISLGAILVHGTHHLFDSILPAWLVSLLADGVGTGIQTVATFIPVISCLYLFMSLLESSGYMARAAFVLHKGMQKLGLPGKAFVPLVLGFGCTVPSVLATRTLEKDHERYLTASMAPFMSCGARLPVYTLFSAAFFPHNGQSMVFCLYLLGIAVAIFTGFVFRKILFLGCSEYLVMEMPNYELPAARDILLKTWNKLKRFILGAGKTIILVVTLLSFLNSLGIDGSFGNQDSEKSVLSQIAQWVTPALTPIGIKEDNWQATVGIITGLFAKEAVVGSLNTLYSSNELNDTEGFSLSMSLKQAWQSIPDNLSSLTISEPFSFSVSHVSKQELVQEQDLDYGIFNNLTANFTHQGAFAYLVFILLYTPCSAALGAYVRELGRPFTLFIFSWSMMLAFVVSTLSYQVMMIRATPWQSMLWISLSLGVLFSSCMALAFFSQAKKNQTWMIR